MLRPAQIRTNGLRRALLRAKLFRPSAFRDASALGLGGLSGYARNGIGLPA